MEEVGILDTEQTTFTLNAGSVETCLFCLEDFVYVKLRKTKEFKKEDHPADFSEVCRRIFPRSQLYNNIIQDLLFCHAAKLKSHELILHSRTHVS